MNHLPIRTLETVQERLRVATVPYKALMTDTAPVIEGVLHALGNVEAIRRNDVNPHFLNRITCEILHKQLREGRGTLDVPPAKPPLSILNGDQQVTAFLSAMGYSINEISALLGWSPRKTKNLYNSSLKTLSIANHQQLVSQQLRFATTAPHREDCCPSKNAIWSCAHGDCDPEETLEAAMHSLSCGKCTELWLLAWAIEPELNQNPLLTRSMTEDMRDNSEPLTLDGPTFRPSLDLPQAPAENQAWMFWVVAVGTLILGALLVLAYMVS